MRNGRALALVGAFAFASLGAPAAGAETAEVAIGYPPAADLAPLFAAKDKGFFEKRHLAATLTRIPLASNIPPAIVAGSLHIGMGTGPMLLQTAEGGLDLVAVGGAARFLKTNPFVSLVARSGLKVARAADLRGRKVGVPGLNSMLHVLFQKWLVDNRVALDQVTMIEAPFPQMKDLLKGATLDAVIAIEPFRTRILSEGVGFRVGEFPADVREDILAAIWMAKRDWVQANPEALRAFREAYAEAIAYCLQNPEAAKELQVKYLGVSSPVVPSYSAEIRTDDLELFARIGRELGLLRQPVDVEKLIAR